MKKRPPFPSKMPVGVVAGVVLSVVSLVACLTVVRGRLEPVQAAYLFLYARVSLPLPWTQKKPSTFAILTARPSSDEGMPVCGADTALLLASRTFEVTDEMVENAGRCAVKTTPGQMQTWLRNTVYEHRSCFQILKPAPEVWVVLAVCCLVIGGQMDAQRKEAARRGVQIRGPELVNRAQFNRRVKGDGFPIVLNNRRTLWERLRGAEGKVLRIRRRDENKNILCMSDPGGGKTSIIFQILDEVERRG
jgi:hypothetical protein